MWKRIGHINIESWMDQRCTLSQLRLGHCHLLQDYKHRVLCEPIDICTDCGASPQDVRHRFACTSHPTDLLSLWRNRVGSIRAFSYLDGSNDSRLHVVEPPSGRSFIWQIGVVVVIDLPLLCVAVEVSDNPVSLEKPCQASVPPDQQGGHSLGRHPEVQYVA